MSERSYFRHSKSPAWGAALLVRETRDQRTYLFVDGVARTFKTAIVAQLLEPADEPSAEDRHRLELGLTSISARTSTGIVSRVPNATPKAIHFELEAAIRAARDDAGPHLVYADWLQTKGDPRGELIVAHHQVETMPGDKRREAAAAALIAAHADYFVPPSLGKLLAMRRTGEAVASEVTWRYGYLDRVRLVRRSPRAPELEPALRELLAHPSARFLRHLVLGPLGEHTAYDYAPLIAAIVAAAPPSLEELVVGDFTPRDTTLSFTRIGNATPLVKSLPALRKLTLRGGKLSFAAAPHHAKLETLVIDTADARVVFGKLARARVPALCSLEVAAPNLVPASSELAALLAGNHAPALRRLVLRDTVQTARILDAILVAPQLARLEELGVPGGDLADAAVPSLVARADTWRHLRRLDVRGNRLGAVAARHLAAGANVAVDADGASSRGSVSESDILALAPDVRVAGGAREVAASSDWLELGRDRERLWGRFASAADFWVSAHLATQETTCTCPSRRRPCKHGLGLLVLAAQQRPIAARPMPAAFRVVRRFRPGGR